MNNQQKIAALHLSIALGCVDAVMQGEKPHSARWNRLKGVIDPINRAIDLYRLESFSPEDLAKASDIHDMVNAEIARRYPHEVQDKDVQRG